VREFGERGEGDLLVGRGGFGDGGDGGFRCDAGGGEGG
jgi:hypothetical protein